MPIDFDNIKLTGDRKYKASDLSALNDSLSYLPVKQRAAVLASILEESQGNSMSVSKTKNYQGLLQWGNDRYKIKDKGKKELSNQLQYLRNTIDNSSDHISWTNGGKGSGYKSYKDTYADFHNQALPLDKVLRAFSYGYVRPYGKEDSFNNRLKVAEQIYSRLSTPEVPVNNIAQPDALRVAKPLIPPVVPEVHNVPFISVSPNAYAEGGMLYSGQDDVPYTPQEEYQDEYQNNVQDTPQEKQRLWDELSLSEKNAFIASAVKHGITNMEDIKRAYNELSQEQVNDTPEETEEDGNKFLKGGYKPSRKIRNYIANKEGASMKTNRSFEAEAKDFWSVMPEDVRSRLTQEQADALYSYSYNVGAINFKHRVVPALQRYFSGNGSVEDVQKHMYATKDSQLRGLAKRRAEERAMFAGSSVPVYSDSPYADSGNTWRSSRLGPVTSINMSKGLGVVNNSSGLLGPVSNERQDNAFMQEAINTLYDDSKPTLMEVPQEEQSSLDRYNAIQDYLSSINPFGYARGGRMYDKGGVTSSNGQYHVEPSEYSRVLGSAANGNPLEVTLPDTTVTAAAPRNYRSYYDPNGAEDFMNATTLGLFPNPFNLSRSASTFMQKPSWDSAWDTTKSALMFAGSAGKEAAFAPLGIMNLMDKDGVRKTYGLVKDGNYAGAAMSGLGDALNAGMATSPISHLATNVRDYNNINNFIERYGYNEYKPKIGLIFNDQKLDRLTEQLVKQHNRFTRGISVAEARKYYGVPESWTDEQVAEYSLTHPHVPRKINSGGNPDRKSVLYTSNSIDLSKVYTNGGNGYIGILQRPIIYDSDRSKMLKMNDFHFMRLPEEVNNNFNPSITTDEPYIVSRKTKFDFAKINKVKGGLAYKHRGRVKRTYSSTPPTFLDAQANAGSNMVPTQLPYDKDFRHYLFYGEPENQLLGLEKMFKYTAPKGDSSIDYSKYSIGFSKKKALGGKL
jgi:GH24 family phage-related lysozyme (muramidase)